MKVLVLGGTGAMGTHLVSILAEAGMKVDVTSRQELADRTNIHYIKGNVHNISFVKSLLAQNYYNVIIDFMIYTTVEFNDRYWLYLNNTDQYFYLSTSRVYADAALITEESPRLLDVTTDKKYLATDEYALCKARQEDLLRDSCKSNFTIIRPYKTYSEIRLQLGALDKETFIQRILQGHSAVIPMDVMSHTTTLTYARDVAICIAKLIGNKKAMGDTFNIVTSKNIKWMDVLDIYLNVLENKMGYRPNVVEIDRCPQLDVNIAQYQILYDLHYNRQFDNTKIKEAVGGYEFIHPKEGLAKCITSFLDNPKFNYLDCRAEGIHDHYSHEFMSLSQFATNSQRLHYFMYRFCPVSVGKIALFCKQMKHK